MNPVRPAGGSPSEAQPAGTEVDHADIIRYVCEEASLTHHYLFMTVLSAGIAVLGLLLSSPAVVIGAMLISPLMGPIVGFGFGLALFDLADLRRAALSLAAGIAVAILFSALIVLLSPLQTITSEIAARTRPNLFDLGVAILSGLAATYAVIRGRHGAIVGVAIAVAVMPPLAVVGFGLATRNMPVLLGSLFLFLTNFVAISLSAAVLARIYGFGRALSPRQTWLQATLIVAILTALAAPLGLALRQIAWETVATRQAQDVIAARFPEESRVSQVNFDFDAEPLRVSATVFAPAYRAQAEAEAGDELSRMLRRPVQVALEQVRIGGSTPQAAQLAAARGAGPDAADALASRLALLAGAEPEAVLIDPTRRIARVRAETLPGAGLATYRELERRAAATQANWSILIVPPALPLPELPDAQEERASALALIAWAARRRAEAVEIAGAGAAELAADPAMQNVPHRIGPASGPLRVTWAGPGS